MKKIIIFLSCLTALLCGCESYIGGIDDYGTEYRQVVFINKSSDEIKITVSSQSWLGGDASIVLQPERGLWKMTRYDVDYSFNTDYMKVKFGQSEEIVFDIYSSFPYNPCWYGKPRYDLWDSRGEYTVYEFDDQVRDTVLAYYEASKRFVMSSFGMMTDLVDSLLVPESSEAYLHTAFPVPSLREDLVLGAAVCKEAESVDKICIVNDLKFIPDSVKTVLREEELMRKDMNVSYYDIENLRKVSLANFGCDFADLTGRASGQKMHRFSGVAITKTYIDRLVSFSDEEAPEEILAEGKDHAFVDNIWYGNFMILLIEADNSARCAIEHFEYEYMTEKLFDRKDIDYHLITLDDNGQFVSTSGGSELLRTYLDGFTAPSIHPIAFSTTDFTDSLSYIHVGDIVMPDVE